MRSDEEIRAAVAAAKASAPVTDSAHRDVEALRRLEARGGWDEADLNDFAIIEASLARLEQVEQERDALEETHAKLSGVATEASLIADGHRRRVQELEANEKDWSDQARRYCEWIQELETALRDAQPWLMVASDTSPQHYETLSRVHEQVRRALAPDTAPQEYECEACGEPVTEAEIAAGNLWCYGDGEHHAPSDTAEERRCPAIHPNNPGDERCRCQRPKGHEGDHHGLSMSGSLKIYPSKWADTAEEQE